MKWSDSVLSDAVIGVLVAAAFFLLGFAVGKRTEEHHWANYCEKVNAVLHGDTVYECRRRAKP